tara:strand:+ start:401967 stop:403052 length:1086 start_codon:yes stop_codon:yes gene_type:complete
MIHPLAQAKLLCPEDVAPSRDDFEVIGVFNPGVVRIDDEVWMLARVAERPLETRQGLTGITQWTPGGESVVEWIPSDKIRRIDPRVVSIKADDSLRLTSISHLRVFRRNHASMDEWSQGACFLPNSQLEEFGVEDARVTRIGKTYWVTYVAVSRTGAATALASSDDLKTFQRHGLIFAPENKDVVLFPQQINGLYYALHRPNPNSRFDSPQVWLATSPDLIHWGCYSPLFAGRQSWEADRIGAGGPPILIDEGWLVIYHGCSRVGSGAARGAVGAYSAGLVLLGRDDPGRVLARSRQPIMVPTTTYEASGFVPGVVFPMAMVESDASAAGECIDVYYGAADTSIAFARFEKQSLLDSLHWL